MSQPFLAEIKMFAGNFAPVRYAFCNGQILSIQSNTALFSLIGTFYGGNGTSNFGLPNMQGRAPMHQGQGPGLQLYVIGEQAGTTGVSLTIPTMPSHVHQISGAVIANTSPTNIPTATAAFTNTSPNQLYAVTTNNLITMAGQSISLTGGSLPHNNVQPFLAVTFIIALQGIFPTRN